MAKQKEEEKKEEKEPEVETTEKEEESEDDYVTLLAQIDTEYDIAYKFMEPKFQKLRDNIKILNNQRRKDADSTAVGDTTTFSIFQTLFASLYNSSIAIEFIGREEGDEETAENLTQMAEFDYTEMKKDEVDYAWIWNTLFASRALVSLEEFVRDPDNNKFYPVPLAIDPRNFLRDPNATSVKGNASGKGGLKYGGMEVLMSEMDMKEHPSFFDGIKMDELSTTSEQNSVALATKEASDNAQGRNTPRRDEHEVGDNTVYPVIEWFTMYERKRVKVWLDGAKTQVLGIKDCEDNEFPLVDRAIFPDPNDWEGTSIIDLCEDKQRLRAVLMNMAKNSLKADQLPTYLFDEDKITNRNDLKLGFNKFIPAKGKGEGITGAIQALQKPTFNMGLLDFVYRAVELSAEKATATTGIQGGALTEGDKTLGEIQAAEAKADTRFSLGAKVFGWSERKFWLMWYKRYKNNFADKIDEKVLRLVGANGAMWRGLTKQDITTRTDPDVKVVSKFVVEQENLKERALLTEYLGLALQDPLADRKYALEKLGKANGLKSDELERLYPPTIDELVAQDENESLNRDSLTEPNEVLVTKDQDHNVHIRVNGRAKENNSTFAHIRAHKGALLLKQSNPEFFQKNELEAEFAAEQELPTPTPKTNVNSVL